MRVPRVASRDAWKIQSMERVASFRGSGPKHDKRLPPKICKCRYSKLNYSRFVQLDKLLITMWVYFLPYPRCQWSVCPLDTHAHAMTIEQPCVSIILYISIVVDSSYINDRCLERPDNWRLATKYSGVLVQSRQLVPVRRKPTATIRK